MNTLQVIHFPPLIQSFPTTETVGNKGEENFTTDSDQRLNLYQLDQLNLDSEFVSTIKKEAQSVACLIYNHCLPLIQDSYQLDPRLLTLSQLIKQQNGLPLGEKENFADEPIAALGTAFLITDNNVMLTAAHNFFTDNKVDDEKRKKMSVVFGFSMQTANKCQLHFPKQDVYKIKKIVAYQFNDQVDNYEDWLLFKLDRQVDRQPLNIDFENSILDQNQIFMLGHPMGLPCKVTLNGAVKKNEKHQFFQAQLDAFQGNSGSPVFHSKNHTVCGILSRGFVTYRKTPHYMGTDESRMQISRKSEGYETCQRVYSLIFVKFYIQAHLGNAESQLNLGGEYLKEGATKKDPNKAHKWIKKSADQGNLQGQLGLGLCYSEGIGVPRDRAKAIEVFQKLGEANLPLGKFFLGYMLYHYGNGADEKKGLDLIQEAAEKGIADAQRFLGIHYFRKGDFLKGMGWLRSGGRQKDAESLMWMGICYEKGLTGSKDEYSAFHCYQEATEKLTQDYEELVRKQDANLYEMERKLAHCEYRLGNCYFKGIGVQQNIYRALEYYKKAAKKRNEKAQYKIAVCYVEGYTDEIDSQKVIAYLQREKLKKKDFNEKKSSYKTSTRYQTERLGNDNKDDERVPDPVKTFERLFNFYNNPHGYMFSVKRSERDYYRRGGDMDHRLGICYLVGYGTKEDKAKAIECFQRAASHGNEQAAAILMHISYENLIDRFENQKITTGCCPVV